MNLCFLFHSHSIHLKCFSSFAQQNSRVGDNGPIQQYRLLPCKLRLQLILNIDFGFQALLLFSQLQGAAFFILQNNVVIEAIAGKLARSEFSPEFEPICKSKNAHKCNFNNRQVWLRKIFNKTCSWGNIFAELSNSLQSLHQGTIIYSQ